MPSNRVPVAASRGKRKGLYSGMTLEELRHQVGATSVPPSLNHHLDSNLAQARKEILSFGIL
jgi:hypothetical protein